MTRPTQEATTSSTQDPLVIAAAASVGLSWYQFFLRGNKQLGIFIGLWPPTFLAFASYFNQKRMEEKMSASTMMSSLRDMIGGQ
ncbi:hypothetical protein DMJ13_17650 [halophilic archaeon]|nr:hypothetical protein DMJ13_17650 [halophilic archaeon]